MFNKFIESIKELLNPTRVLVNQSNLTAACRGIRTKVAGVTHENRQKHPRNNWGNGR